MGNTPSRDDYLKLIGEIAVNMSRLETYLRDHIGDMICKDFGANARVTAEMPFIELAVLFRSLFLYRVNEPSLCKQCEKLYDFLVNTINPERNIARWALNTISKTMSLINWNYFFPKYNQHLVI
jgi:hypothetical protein